MELVYYEIQRDRQAILLEVLRRRGLQVDCVYAGDEIVRATCTLDRSTTTLTFHPAASKDSDWVLSDQEFSLLNSVSASDVLHVVTAALDEVEAKRSLPALIKLFRNAEGVSRQALAEEITEIGIPMLPELVALAQDSDARLRTWAVSLIGEIGETNDEVRSALESRLEDQDRDVRAESACSLSMLGCSAQKALPILLQSVGESLEKELSSSLDEEGACTAVIEAIGRFGAAAASAVPVLVAALHDDSTHVQQAAADALGKIGPEADSAVTKLDAMLTEALRLVPFRAADEATSKCWRSCHNQVRIAVAEARCRIGGHCKEAIDGLCQILEGNEGLIIDCLLATRAMGRIGQGSKEVASALKRVSEDARRDDSLRRAARDALKEIGVIE